MQNPNTSSEQEQALAVFNHAAEEIRFFKGQQWHVTNYALLTFAALAVVPSWLEPPRWAWFANLLCTALVILPAWGAVRVLKSLDGALQKERGRMEKARDKLPLVREMHAAPEPRDRIVSWLLYTAVGAGAYFAIFINLSRIINLSRSPQVVACLTAGP
jgi:hypothetical protein